MGEEEGAAAEFEWQGQGEGLIREMACLYKMCREGRSIGVFLAYGIGWRCCCEMLRHINNVLLRRLYRFVSWYRTCILHMIVSCISIALSRNYEEFILVFNACTHDFRVLEMAVHEI